MSNPTGLSSINILIAEDLHAETEALLRELSDGNLNFSYAVVQDEAGYIKQLREFKPDVILSPYSLATTNAVKLLGIARKNGVNAPFLLLAYDLSEDIAIDLLGEGIEDYILRSTIKRLPVAIRKALQRLNSTLQLQLSEARLKASEMSMRNMVRKMPIAVAMFDADMNYLVVSDTWLEHEKKTEKELIGNNHYEIVPEIPEPWKKIHQKVLSGEIHGSDREKMVRSDGAVEILRWKMNPWYDANGLIGGAVLFIEDITKIVETRNKEEKNQQLLAIGEDLGNSGSFELDMNSGTSRWSDNMYKIKGFELSADISHENYIKHVHPEDRPKYLETFSKIQSSIAPQRFEYRLIRPDNDEVVCLRVASTFLTNSQGEIDRLIGTVQDVTEQQSLESSVKKSEASLKLAQSIAKIGSWDLNTDDNTVSWSDEMFVIHELEKQEVNVGLIRELIHPDDILLFDAKFEELVLGNEVEMVYRNVLPVSKEVKYFRAIGRVSKRPDGTINNISGTVQEIHERVVAKQELEAKTVQRDLLLSTAKIGIWHWTVGSEKLIWDENCAKIFDEFLPDLRAERYYQLIHPEDRDYVRNQLIEGLKTGEYSAEYRLVKDASTTYVLSRGRATLNIEGRATRIDGIIIDVTEQHLLEKTNTELPE